METQSKVLVCGRYRLDLRYPLIMGIVNVTDDSFSGDGLGDDPRRAVAHGRRLVEEGAAMLDIGGESSRPGAEPISIERELARVLPVMEGLRDCGVPLSVDTVKPEVMSAVIAAGADMLAVVTDLFDAMDIRRRAGEFMQLFNRPEPTPEIRCADFTPQGAK